MFLYNLIKFFLFLLDPEISHRVTIFLLRFSLKRNNKDFSNLKNTVFGLQFNNPVGIAAGFDKNAEIYKQLFHLGFGFVEVGTVTPQPQSGNPKPRVFRLKKEEAIINSLGFNSDGFDAIKIRLPSKRDIDQIVGVNIGANKESENFIEDYKKGIENFSNCASYITVNISSPNTPGLRDLQLIENLNDLIKNINEVIEKNHNDARPPILLKIAPDMEEEDIKSLCSVVLSKGIDGIIISNTTLDRSKLNLNEDISGGLSGAPLFELSTYKLNLVYRLTKGNIPLIGVGGIDSAEKAYEKIRNGATLVQLYTGLVYNGPELVANIKEGLSDLLERDGFENISNAIGIDVKIK